MNSTQFAHAWLDHHGLFDKESDYEGWLGRCLEDIVALIASQGHSGGSMVGVLALLPRIYKEYESGKGPIWDAYWQSDEGKRLRARVGGPPQEETPL